jgi:hypothetical protein
LLFPFLLLWRAASFGSRVPWRRGGLRVELLDYFHDEGGDL